MTVDLITQKATKGNESGYAGQRDNSCSRQDEVGQQSTQNGVQFKTNELFINDLPLNK